MNIKDISTQLLYTTVPIFAQRKDNTVSAGTGFIFSVDEGENKSIPLLITSYHVLEDALAGFVELHIGEHGKPTNKTVRVQFDRSIISENKLGELDVIAIPLASTLMNFQSAGVDIFFRSVDQNMIPSIEQEQNLAAIENITFIGYPSSIYDEKNKLSIVRKGITATPIWNSFRGEETFLIDAGVFPGSSGSPVFIFNQGSYPTTDGITIGNRLLFVGIISATMVREKNDYLNLGIVINSRAMYRELEVLIHKLKQR
ncbi:Trypsin-like peptidase domain-containing protein [Sarcina sp. DSM 11001]|uniref:S1 family peptidase n=1 Tax=Sarcina sp. DSM 11001 TaxID=1798184 RepID=UPI00088F7A41|nr:serine protease [Sarcina sp. DSM 11001]SDK44888.1 Trypsin-like peptidase domain-containing protein [Sarcina sp. DSM 11001]